MTSTSSRCRRAARSASSSVTAIPVTVIDDPDDAIATGAARRAPGRPAARGGPQPHVPGRAGRDPGGDRPRRDRPAAAVRRLDRPLEPGPVRGGPARAAHPDPADGPAHRRLPVDRREAPPRGSRHRPDLSSSTTGSTSSATTTRTRAARCARSTGCPPRARSSASSPGSSRRRATRRSSRPGRRSSPPCPTRPSSSSARAAGARRSRRMATSSGSPDRVVFTGRRDDVPAVTAALDVAVLPSYREALGLTILEAMALSRPVVASNVGGIPEMIEDGVTGLLVPPRDPAALAAAIVRLLRDHPLADTLGPGGPRPGPRAVLHRADGRGGRADLRRGCPGGPPERGRGRLGRSGDLHRRRAG